MANGESEGERRKKKGEVKITFIGYHTGIEGMKAPADSKSRETKLSLQKAIC